MRVQVPAIDKLEDLLDRFGPYGRTNSSFVVSTPVPTRPVPFD